MPKTKNVNEQYTKDVWSQLTDPGGDLDNTRTNYDAAINAMQNAPIGAQAINAVNGYQAVNGLGQYAGYAQGGVQAAQAASNRYGGMATNLAQQGALQSQLAAAGLGDDAGLNTFMAYSPAVQRQAFGQFSPMQQALNAQASDQAHLAMQAAGQQYSKNNALHSGAAAAAMGTAASREFANVQNQLGMAQAQYGAQLQQQLMQQTSANAQQRAALGVQASGQGINAGQVALGAGQLGMSAAEMQSNIGLQLSQQDLQRNLANQQAYLQNAQLAQEANMFNSSQSMEAQALNQQNLQQIAAMQQNMAAQAQNAYYEYGSPAYQTQPTNFENYLNYTSQAADTYNAFRA